MSDLRKAAEIALEACEHIHRTGDTQVFDLCYADKVIPALRQALAQPEQEVLVWMNKYGHVSSTQSEEYNAPLYTAPPKREWVGLTRKEAEDVVDDFITIGGDVENWVGYWRAIEAKLKEKNT